MKLRIEKVELQGERVLVSVQVMDDDRPIRAQTFDFDGTVTIGKVRQQVRAWGNQVRDSMQRIAELRAHVGEEIEL